MNRIAFLSADHLEGYVIDDDLAYAPLRDLGCEVQTISWRNDKVDWSQFDCAIIRSTWDYQRDLPGFLADDGRHRASDTTGESHRDCAMECGEDLSA